jgi:hypothetical protein
MVEPELKPAPTREPRALSSEYHKARNKLMLWAGILFVWELVGVDLDCVANSDGNIGTLVSSLKSRQAVPWALLILVSYFLGRLTIEWCQCSEARRKVRPAKIDFFSSLFIAIAAYALYFGQKIFRLQVANLPPVSRLLFAFGGILTVLIATFAVMILVQIFMGRIDLQYLLNDRDNDNDKS